MSRVTAPGFSLVEVTVSMVIVATMLAAAAAAVGAAARTRTVQADAVRATVLGQGLMAEILQCRYTETSKAMTFGLEAGETFTDRTTLDDVDDYDGLEDSPPMTRIGQPVAGATGWKRSVRVAFVKSDAVDTPTGSISTDTGIKRILVTVTSPRGVQTDFVALRSSGGATEQAIPSSGLVTWLGIQIREGTRAGVEGGTNMLNQPTP